MGNAFNACFMSCNTARNVIRTIVFRYKGHADDNNNVCKHDRGRTFFKWDMYFVVSAVGQVFAAIAFLDQRCSVVIHSDLDEQRCRREQAEAVVGGVHRLDCLAGFFVAEHTCITAHQFYITQKDSNNR